MKRKNIVELVVPLAIAALLAIGCGPTNPDTDKDITRPAPVENLAVSNSTTHSIAITWNAPGDDSLSGKATQYDVRYSKKLITTVNFDSAASAYCSIAPKSSGLPETLTVSGLGSDSTYYFALKTRDEANNWSGLSRVPFGKTSSGAVPPTVVIDSIGVITKADAYVYCDVISDGGATVTVSGVCWGTVANPTMAGSKTSCGTGIGPYQCAITGLTANTLYHVRAYATNSVGTGYSGDSSFTTPSDVDTIPPCPITDIGSKYLSEDSVAIQWTAPGNDCNVGTAAEYDVRYSKSQIDSSNWNSAIQVTGKPVPRLGGTHGEHMTIRGLEPCTPYFFAIKTKDSAGNWSKISTTYYEHISTLCPCPDSIESRFNSNTEGWSSYKNGGAHPVWVATGGNPGGYIKMHDSQSGAWAYFVAPSKYLGKLSCFVGGSLSFDLWISDLSYENVTYPDIVLEGSGITIVYDIQPPLAQQWTSYSVNFNASEGKWKIGTRTSISPKVATESDIAAVLANVTGLLIRGEFTSQYTNDNTYLDNVVIRK